MHRYCNQPLCNCIGTSIWKTNIFSMGHTYVPLSKVPLFLFPGTVTLDSNNHSGLEIENELKNMCMSFLLSKYGQNI